MIARGKAEAYSQIFEVYSEDESNLLRLLSSFGVKVRSIDLVRERFFDHYNIRLSPGTRASKIDRLLPDIGLHLESKSIPTGSLIMSEGVYRLSIQTADLNSPPIEDLVQEMDNSFFCPIVLGVKSDGEPLVKDLSKMPNLLVAGTTGSGKSVLLHSIVMSALFGGAKVYISDPKMVEFDRYKDILGVKKVVNSYEETLEIVEDLISTMNNRFSFLKKKGARSACELFASRGNRELMSPIILVIDEWADLVLQDKDIQKKLCILAQKGRAAGISVILSTQRPSSSVISGLIKANFPGRVALRVASLVDSRVILDQSGAEKLSSVGTGLFLDGKASDMVLFRAPNIVDIKGVMDNLNLKGGIKSSIWSKLGWG